MAKEGGGVETRVEGGGEGRETERRERERERDVVLFFVLVLAKAALKICAGQKKLQIVLNSEKEIGLLFVLPVIKKSCDFLVRLSVI